MRWSQGAWSEERLVEAVNATGQYYALPYGPSGVAPEEPRALELYFERLQAAGLGDVKRPDILIFAASDREHIDEAVGAIGGRTEIPFTTDQVILDLGILDKAILAVECENSLWKCQDMPQYGEALRPMRRLGGKLGLPKGAVLPTIILKDEDRAPLQAWQSTFRIPIHIWHVFYDMAFGLCLQTAEDLIASGHIEVTLQTFQAPSGPTTEKGIFKIYYHYAYRLAEATQDAELIADKIIDKNGHILPYVRFEGGQLRILPSGIQQLADAAAQRHNKGS